MKNALILQRLTFPDLDIAAEPALYFRGTDPRHMTAGQTSSFDAYVNLFNLGNWTYFCDLTGLRLWLSGTGTLTLRIWHNGETLLQTEEITLTPKGQSVPLDASLGGVISFDIAAETTASIASAHFVTNHDPARHPPIGLAVVITTFRREEAVSKTAARMTAHLDTAPDLDTAHLFVVDNGQSLALPDHPRLTLIPNRNLGGAGGFARGLLAAETAGGFTHVLFMDDDATFAMENLHRTAAFLQLARDPKTALAGAMISELRPWQMWENGAIFDQQCHPQFNKLDLRDTAAVIAMENATPAKPANFYGGWWYFAFPIEDLKYYPFPFFVRGDDVSFSLSNAFKPATLNGVMSFQEDFFAKASPLTHYLDLRYHLHVALVQNGHDRGRVQTLLLAARHIGGSIFRMHYETATAELLALQDIINGADVFTNDPTMQAKRAQIGTLTKTERWMLAPAQQPTQNQPLSRTSDILNKLTINGHLIPGFGWFGRHARIPVKQRGKLWATAWASSATFSTLDQTQSYTVRHNKWTFAKLICKGAWLSLLWLTRYRKIQDTHRESFPKLASRNFWESAFRD